MREITFKTLALDGTGIEESKLTVGEGEMLIMQPTYNMTLDMLINCHKLMERALKQDNAELITLPHGIEFKVLKIK